MRNYNQKSCLILGSNSIGNPKDIPTRVLEYVKTADLLVFEEDRPARVVLKVAGIHKDYLKYSEHEQQATIDEIRSAFKLGKTVLYMSDQGCPNLADPATNILKLAYSMKVKILTIPGPSSITSAISACPFDMSTFLYKGFLPRDDKKNNELEKLSKFSSSIIILDTPYRLVSLLESCSKILTKRRGFLALDISGESENYLVGSFQELLDFVIKNQIKKTNFVLIIENKI